MHQLRISQLWCYSSSSSHHHHHHHYYCNCRLRWSVDQVSLEVSIKYWPKVEYRSRVLIDTQPKIRLVHMIPWLVRAWPDDVQVKSGSWTKGICCWLSINTLDRPLINTWLTLHGHLSWQLVVSQLIQFLINSYESVNTLPSIERLFIKCLCSVDSISMLIEYWSRCRSRASTNTRAQMPIVHNDLD